MKEHKSIHQILKELKEYNDTHEHAYSYGKYIQMLDQEDKKKRGAGERKSGKRKNPKSYTEKF